MMTCQASAAHGARAEPIRLDVRSMGAIDACIAAMLDTLGCIDIWVNHAGVPFARSALEVEPDECDQVRVNVRGAYFLAQRFARELVVRESRGVILIRMRATTILTG